MLLGFAAFVILMLTLPLDGKTLVDEVTLVPSYFVPALCFTVAAIRSPERRLRRVWAWSAVAWICNALGESIYAYYAVALHQSPPYPSLDDLFYLLSYAFLAVGLTLFPAISLKPWQRAQFWLDSAIFTGSLFAVSWYFLLGPLALQGGSTPLQLAVTLAYPLGDLAIIVALFALVLRGTYRQLSPVLVLLLVGQLAYVYADSAWSYLNVQNAYVEATLAIDAFWVLGGLITALAPLYLLSRFRRSAGDWAWPGSQPLEAESPEEQRPLFQSLLPYSPVVAVLLISIPSVLRHQANGPIEVVFTFLAIGVAFLVLGRQGLTLWSQAAANRRLRELNVQALAAARAKAEFLATMSHELRTPITTATLSREVPMKSGLAASEMCTRSKRSIPRSSWAHGYRPTTKCRCSTMNGVIGMAELVLQTPLSDEQRDYLQTLHGSAYALLGVLNDILDFSKIEAGKLEVERAPFDPREAVEAVADILSPKAREKGLALMAFVAPEVPARVLGDTSRVRQILLNLVGNAVKFTEAGQVAVRLTLAGTGPGASGDAREAPGAGQDHASHVATGRLADEVPPAPVPTTCTLLYEVVDTGIGLSEAARSRLFLPFSQADGSTTRKYGGTGLGLSISKRLVELMGGEIGVESREGQGSTFWFTLPCSLIEGAGEGAGQQIATAAERDAELDGKRILVVDDNTTQREILRSYLAAHGMRVVCLPDATRALATLLQAARHRLSIDVVLIDLMLPGVDGFALAQAIRLQPELAATRLVLLTAFDEAGLGKRALRLGFKGYLTKPLKLRALLDTLAQLLAAPAAPAVNDVPTLGRDAEPLQVDEPTPEQRNELAGAMDRPPLAVVAETGNGEQPPTPPAIPAHPRLLLAEDNAVNRKLALLQLKRLGYEADVAEDGREVLQRLGRQSYALVLMDCHMPEMDGYEATRLIRTQERERDSDERLPIIAMTANALEGDRERCVAAGMDDYLSKPVTLESLRQVLGRWVPVVPAGHEPGSPAQTGDFPGSGNQPVPGPVPAPPGTIGPSRWGEVATRAHLKVVPPRAEGIATGETWPIAATTSGVGQETTAAAASAPPIAAEERGRVLVVEDYPLNQRLTRLQLERLGLAVDIVANGKEALESLGQRDYALVLMDCQMPVMDGYAATRAIRLTEAAHRVRHTPIVAVTANALQGDRERCLLAGMDDYLAKPVRLGDLEHVVRQWLSGTTSAPLTPTPVTGGDADHRQAAREAVAGAVPTHPDEAAGTCFGECPTGSANASETALAPVFDETALAALRDLQRPDQPNQIDVEAALLEEFRSDVVGQLRQMRTALDADDLSTLQRAAHTLKSGAAHVGARRLAQVCALTETLCRAEVEAVTGTAAAPTIDRGLLFQLVTQAEAAYDGFLKALDERASASRGQRPMALA
jgi:CheY-like chemotaxis protein